jgi:predicted Fe-Mo cluster-binding NifX family protein
MKRITFACEDAQGLDGLMSGHFGRCSFYTLVDVEKDEVKNVIVIENPYASNHIPGKVPEFIRDQKAHVMIAGGIGPRAIDLFSGFGIEVHTGVSGRVKDVLEAYLKGDVKGTVACAHDHKDSCGHGH